jgi:hypothetical protein
MHTYKIGDLVLHPCDNAPFEVVGVRADEIEIEGDWSGGTHNTIGRDWVKPDVVKPYNKYMNYPYYKSNPIPSKFAEEKPEWRIRDLKTGKWISKYSGGKSWYQKSACVDALDKLIKSRPDHPSRYIIEEYNLQLVQRTTGIIEVHKKRDLIAEKRRLEEAKLNFEKNKRIKIQELNEMSVKEFGVPCDALMLMLSRGIISEVHIDDVTKMYIEYNNVEQSKFNENEVN